MQSFAKRVIVASAIAAASLAAVSVQAQAPAPGAPAGRPQLSIPGRDIYAANCSGCHGTDLGGGRAPSLFNEKLLSTLSDDSIQKIVETGIADAGMPSFKGVLDTEKIHQTIAFLRLQAGTMKAQPPFTPPSPAGQVIKSQKQTFKVEVVASGLETPWGELFLPDGRMLVTERAGRLRIIQNGKLQAEPVKNTPKVWERQDSGMLDIVLHPDYKKNGWIYMSYTDSDPSWVAPPPPPPPAPGQPAARPVSPPSMTVLIRGRINAKNEWVDTQEIFRAPYSLYTPSGAHYGMRMVFDKQGYLYFSLGERGDQTNAQKLTVPLGKIHRVKDDGSIPADNPFVNTPGAVKSIWTCGHRNPEGLAFDPVTGQLWESEHGPTGGDEINVIVKGHNYGWGVASMGVQPGITKQHEAGMDDPVAYYTPTLAPSGINFYAGSKYPGWKNSLFVSMLAGQQLRRLEVSGGKVTAQEVVFNQFGRTRQVITGPDGLLYVLIQNPTGGNTGVSLSATTPGMVIRLVPVK
jgi:glucose/arabinose dehydrogenase